MLNFKNKTVMITGAAGNRRQSIEAAELRFRSLHSFGDVVRFHEIGRAVAEAFGSRGANLVLLDLNGEALESAYPGDDAHSLKCAADLMKADDIAEAVKAAKAKFGGLDALAAIAGGFPWAKRSTSCRRISGT